ncbi:MAG: exodeoxyribonuclease VII large subunit [Rhodospirillaceae bacterium]|jgi:exodeoxyribonuclease VII large subunit|nr:exodeoxyribonuclease VII large subunit [Rhodospirillaceae bacterium]MBT5809950.1 exodeoxyribonuclease VII large subunit [Rhodospirillaceae bacterium]
MNDKSPETTTNLTEYSVSALSLALKRTVEESYSYVRVRGEVSGFKRAASGHLYLALKDDKAVLDAVCWRGVAGRLAIQPEDGMEVVATGKLTTYPGRSKYQIVIDSIELAGEGALLKLLEDRRKKLAAEGLFDEERKQPLPFLPSVIGVVTSPTGAVIRDILHRLSDRFPRHVLLAPVLVQGQDAAAQVAAAINGFNAMDPSGPVPRPDLLIIARGGGSLEDLWAFNEEVVVRAAAASRIPLISAIGHETDTTLIDFAADYRAPTPTAAAERAVPVREALLESVIEISRRLIGGMARLFEDRRLRVELLARGLPDASSLLGVRMQRFDGVVERLVMAGDSFLDQKRQAVALTAARLRRPEQVLTEKQSRLSLQGAALAMHMRRVIGQLEDRLSNAGGRFQSAPVARRLSEGKRTLDRLAPALDAAYARRAESAQTRLTALSDLLESYSFKRVLDRGYAVVRDSDGVPITTVDGARPGDAVGLEFSDGSASAIISGDTSGRRPAPKRGRGKKTKPDPDRDPDRQGSLL